MPGAHCSHLTRHLRKSRLQKTNTLCSTFTFLSAFKVTQGLRIYLEHTVLIVQQNEPHSWQTDFLHSRRREELE
ncbi:hypothetical protein BDR03DRAFT_958613 [Suillus americanus]|nr:hypothetical protein BDR03DRAFT_958613 [Suillus americanus]